MSLPGWLAALVPTGVLGTIIVVLIKNPEKAQAWSGIIGGWLSKLPGAYEWGSKHFLKYDLQTRINRFTKVVAAQGSLLAQERVEVKWVDSTSDLGALLAEGRVIVTLDRREDPDRGFIRACLLFVQASLLADFKACMNVNQATSLDAYLLRSLLRVEHPDLLQVFDAEFLDELNYSNHVQAYYKKYAILEARGLFWDVYLPELSFAGQRAKLGGPKQGKRVAAIDRMLNFLVDRAGRSVGQQVECEHLTRDFRFALVYVGMHEKVLKGADTWIAYINKRLSNLRPDTIYLISRAENLPLIEEISAGVASTYAVAGGGHRDYTLRIGGTDAPLTGYISCLRSLRPALATSFVDLRGVEDVPLTTDDQPKIYTDKWDGDDLENMFRTVTVSGVLDSGGFVSCEDLGRSAYFAHGWVSPFALPVERGQKGVAKFRVVDGHLRVAPLRLEPRPGRWVGQVEDFNGKWGTIVCSDASTCDFSLSEWSPDAPPLQGSRVEFRVRLKENGYYEAVGINYEKDETAI